jgi:hypothetical protein
MKRTKNTKKINIPDVINQSITKEFTQVPNDLLRNPKLSFKAKGILCLLLSNKKGWYSYLETIKQMSKEGEDALRNGIAELEEFGYLLRIQFRDKKTKVRRGSFWAYTDTPGNFDMDDTIEMLEEQGLEPFIYQKNNTENPNLENPDMDTLDMGNPGLKILKIKRHKNKKTNSLSDPSGSDDEIEDYPSIGVNNKPTTQERNKKFLPLASKLADAVRSKKNIKVDKNKLKSWTNEIRKLVESDGVNPDRIETALDWYQENIGGDYVPEIESGFSLRNKFIRLEEAIKRDNGKFKPSKLSNAHHEPGKQYPC